MRRRRSRRYRWLPAAFTAGGLALILLGGVAAAPGRAPDDASTAQVGLVADNASATVVPNADFLKARAQALTLLDEAVQRLRATGASSTAAAADRLEAIAGRLSQVTPSQPEELEAIVADINREVTRGIVGRPNGATQPDVLKSIPLLHLDAVWSDATQPTYSAEVDRLSLLREVLGILRDIIGVLRQLIESLFPPPPYTPPPYGPPHH